MFITILPDKSFILQIMVPFITLESKLLLESYVGLFHLLDVIPLPLDLWFVYPLSFMLQEVLTNPVHVVTGS